MMISSEEIHRALAYLVAVTRFGRPIPVALFDEYAMKPDPQAAVTRTVGGTALSSLASASTDWSSFIESMFGKREVMKEAERPSEYLVRVGWAEVKSGSMEASALGASVLQALNSAAIEVPSDDPISVVIDPSDPLAYARVFALISAQSDGMVVDPYLGVKEFFELLELAPVTRVLMSDRNIKKNKPTIAQALYAVAEPPTVRYAEAKQLHDRFFIPEDGEVLLFGSSLNSITRRPGVVTPLSDEAAGAAIRKAYEEIWADATEIDPVKPKA